MIVLLSKSCSRLVFVPGEHGPVKRTEERIPSGCGEQYILPRSLEFEPVLRGSVVNQDDLRTSPWPAGRPRKNCARSVARCSSPPRWPPPPVKTHRSRQPETGALHLA